LPEADQKEGWRSIAPALENQSARSTARSSDTDSTSASRDPVHR